MEIRGWKQIDCIDCGGGGQVSAYTPDGRDFEGAEECKTCHGVGKIWRSPKGKLAKFPGGRFLGSVATNEQ